MSARNTSTSAGQVVAEGPPGVVETAFVRYLRVHRDAATSRPGVQRTTSDMCPSPQARDAMHFFHDDEAASVALPRSESINSSDRDDDLQMLANRVEPMRGHREHFNPGG